MTPGIKRYVRYTPRSVDLFVLLYLTETFDAIKIFFTKKTLLYSININCVFEFHNAQSYFYIFGLWLPHPIKSHPLWTTDVYCVCVNEICTEQRSQHRLDRLYFVSKGSA